MWIYSTFSWKHILRSCGNLVAWTQRVLENKILQVGTSEDSLHEYSILLDKCASKDACRLSGAIKSNSILGVFNFWSGGGGPDGLGSEAWEMPLHAGGPTKYLRRGDPPYIGGQIGSHCIKYLLHLSTQMDFFFFFEIDRGLITQERQKR